MTNDHLGIQMKQLRSFKMS